MDQLLIAAGSFLIGVFITRWIFGIDSILKSNKVQIGLLILMAKKQGATTEEVDEILDKVYGKEKK